MATKLQKQSIRNIGIYGIIRQSEIDDSLIPEGAMPETVNFHFDRKGAAKTRPGLTAIGSSASAGNSCVGLHNVLSATAIAVFDNSGTSSTIYAFNGTSWAISLDGGTSGIRMRFADFGSYTIVPNFIYNTLSSMRFWDGGTRNWRFTGNPINPQNMWGYNPQLLEVYKSRVYAAGDTSIAGNPSRLFFSSVITAAGNITWDPATDFVDINPGDGEGITGLKRFSLELLVFKPNYIYRFRT